MTMTTDTFCVESWLGGKVNANFDRGAVERDGEVGRRQAGDRVTARRHSNIGVDRRRDRVRLDSEANLGMAGHGNQRATQQ